MVSVRDGRLCLLVLVLGTLSSSLRAQPLNLRPIIGVVSEAVNNTTSYIVASYVKFIECAGGRVVPIFSNSTEEELETLFHSINGILFPGGVVSLDTSGYAKIGRTFLKLAMKANDEGDYFPIWGTCLGFELLCHLVGGDVIGNVDAYNISLPLNLTSAAYSSRLFSLFPGEAMEWVSTEALTTNMHNYGVTMATFQASSSLTEFFTLLSTSKDRNGVEFVSTIEAKKYPIYGVQWHPEKSGFEWTTELAINHSEHAVAVMQDMADFFVQEARKNTHRFPSQSVEEKTLIYNYSPQYTQNVSHFTQIYFFQ